MADWTPDDEERRRRLGLPVQATTNDIRKAVIAELGDEHPNSRFAKDWPTVEEGKAAMTIGLTLFHHHQATDGGRAGMLAALEGALCYLHASLPVRDHKLLLPLSQLFFALSDLDRTGRKAPCFRAKSRGPTDSGEIAYFKACVLAISDLIAAHKGCSQDQADIEAARKASPKAKALGLATRVVAKDLDGWRRGTRRRREPGADHDLHLAAVQRQIERLAPMFAKRKQRDLDELIQAVLYHGPRAA
jgi:hypothetical protein